MGWTPRLAPVSWFVLIAVLPLLAPASASAVTMTLKGGKPAVDRSGVVEATEWTMPDDGGTASRSDHDGTYTGTWTFPMPTKIPDAGISVDVSVMATTTMNSFGHHTRFVPSMTISGSLVKGGNVQISADSNSDTAPSKTTNGTVELTAGHGSFDVTVQLSDGPRYTYTYVSEADEPPPPPEGGPVVTLGDIKGKVEVQRNRGAWEPATPGMELKQGDKVHTGFKASVKLTFPDGSTVVLQPMGFLSLDRFDRDDSKLLRVRLLLKSGEVKAQIQRLAGTYGDFQVKTPTTTASVRGTIFSVLYDGTATLVAVTESSVDVTANSGETVVVPTGMQASSTAKGVAKPVAIGRGEKRGGLTAAKARARLAARLGKGLAACKFDVLSSRLKPAKGGWTGAFVIVRTGQGIGDKPQGTAKLRLKGKRVVLANALAKRVARGCK